MENITNTKTEKLFHKKLIEFEERLKTLKDDGYVVEFFDMKVLGYKNIGKGLDFNNDLNFRYVQGSMRKVPTYATYAAFERKYSTAISEMEKYCEYLFIGEIEAEKINTTVEQARSVLDYTISDKGLYNWMDTCFKFLHYPMRENTFSYFVEAIYKIIKIEYQRNYSSEMLQWLSDYIKVPLRSGEELKLAFYDKINKLVEADMKKCLSNNFVEKNTLDFFTSSDIYNNKLLNVLVCYETGDFTSLHERIRALELKLNELKPREEKKVEVVIEEEPSVGLFESISKILTGKKQSNKQPQFDMTVESHANFDSIGDGIYIVPLLMFNKIGSCGKYKYEVYDLFDLVSLKLDDKDEEMPLLTDSHIIVEVDKNNPNYVTEVLTGMMIPVTYSYKFVPLEGKEKNVEEQMLSETPAYITVKVDILGREVVDSDTEIGVEFTSQFSQSDNIDLLKQSVEKRDAVLKYYRYLHPNVYEFENTLRERTLTAKEEYYRFLKDCVNKLDKQRTSSNEAAVQYIKK